MYIVLIGPSGKCRKGTAMSLGKSIVKEIGIPMTAETMTREALIRTMADSAVHFTDRTTGKLVFHSSLYTVSEELSVFLGQGDVRFLADLTDWYDASDEWKYDTKHSGKDHLQNICFNLLGGTAPDWLTSILPQEAVGGGFTSRIIFVVEENKAKIVPNPPWTDWHESRRKDLIYDLEIINSLTGEFMVSTEAQEAYETWYEEQEKQIMDGKPPVNDARFAGYCDRRATHARKLSMILSASRGNKKLVEKIDFTRSVRILEMTEQKMPRVFAGLGEARYGKITQELLDFITLRGRTTKEEVMQIYYRDLDNYTLEIIEKVLTTMKAVKVIHKPDTGEVIYEAQRTPKFAKFSWDEAESSAFPDEE